MGFRTTGAQRLAVFARRNTLPLAMLGVTLVMLGAMGCGGSATAQPKILAGDILQAFDGTVILGPEIGECRLQGDPDSGLAIRDPNGIRITNPAFNLNADNLHTLLFGPDDPDSQGECRIRAGPGAGMMFQDPAGFSFTNNVQVQGDVMANNFVQESSRHLKSNIRPIADALDCIARLEGVYFDWKPERGGRASLGFVAEDVAKVLPQLVSRDAATGRVKGVQYANVVAVAVEGIKAQETKLDRLTAENAKLRAKVDAMEARLEQLCARMEKSAPGK